MILQVLAVLFAICMQGLFASSFDKTPARIARSLANLTLSLGPISNNTNEGSLIRLNRRNATMVQKWVNLLNHFLKDYTADNTRNLVVCNFGTPPPEGKACDVDMANFNGCSTINDFNYNASSPCVYLRLNRIYGWVPEYYNDTNNLPSDMPSDLVTHIKAEQFYNSARANQIWVSCTGKHPIDQEHVNASNFEYFPTRGFPAYFYPATSVDGYLSPLIAVKLNGLTPNVIISIECRAWAKNIKYHGEYGNREGLAHFEILIDA
ncbi:hypothetical protein Trydic_g22379 [Trypoxylus dichotomus]